MKKSLLPLLQLPLLLLPVLLLDSCLFYLFYLFHLAIIAVVKFAVKPLVKSATVMESLLLYLAVIAVMEQDLVVLVGLMWEV